MQNHEQINWSFHNSGYRVRSCMAALCNLYTAQHKSLESPADFCDTHYVYVIYIYDTK